jgi:GNAT superfamily N-acetyltransferase
LDRRKFHQEAVFEFTKIEEIPLDILEILEGSLGHDWLAAAEDIFSKGGAILTVILIDGRLATISWIQNGAAIPKWIIPLLDDDCVFSRGYTIPDFRGQGCYARCIAAGYDSVSLKRGRLLTACHICNTPSIRQFKRSGFEIVARGHFKS